MKFNESEESSRPTGENSRTKVPNVVTRSTADGKDRRCRLINGYVGAAITQRIVNQALRSVDESKSPMERLSDRKLEIFRMIGEGLTSGAIANRLLLSSHTIDTHRENLKRKLELKNSGELSRAAVQWVLENG
ncbi:response regulator transcription factor [Anatilimnocola aggregata]|nr:LuxR C-terminal-related transcriptional regulator [Anatilimnocola aggregata]